MKPFKRRSFGQDEKDRNMFKENSVEGKIILRFRCEQKVGIFNPHETIFNVHFASVFRSKSQPVTFSDPF